MSNNVVNLVKRMNFYPSALKVMGTPGLFKILGVVGAYGVMTAAVLVGKV